MWTIPLGMPLAAPPSPLDEGDFFNPLSEASGSWQSMSAGLFRFIDFPKVYMYSHCIIFVTLIGLPMDLWITLLLFLSKALFLRGVIYSNKTHSPAMKDPAKACHVPEDTMDTLIDFSSDIASTCSNYYGS